MNRLSLFIKKLLPFFLLMIACCEGHVESHVAEINLLGIDIRLIRRLEQTAVYVAAHDNCDVAARVERYCAVLKDGDEGLRGRRVVGESILARLIESTDIICLFNGADIESYV